jgi:hypothetical protein
MPPRQILASASAFHFVVEVRKAPHPVPGKALIETIIAPLASLGMGINHSVLKPNKPLRMRLSGQEGIQVDE